MGMMSRMRSLAPWFIITVGGIFVLFMVISDSNVFEFMQRGKQNVGSVDGEEITYTEFSELLERARKNQEQSTGQTIDESQMDFFRDQIWDALVTQKLLNQKIKEFGIVVTNEEVRSAILGPNPPAMLRQQFTDSTGNFNRQLYETALKDPRNKEIVIAVEEQIREQLIQEKLQNYLSASISASEEETFDNFIKQNIKMNADYVMIDPNTIPDTDVNVTDADLKKYYEAHPEEFKIENQRKLKYLLFRREASQSDSLGVLQNLQEIVKKIKTDTASFKSYVEIYSEQPYKKDTVSLSTLPVQARDALVKGNKGDIIGPVSSYEGYIVYKLNDKIGAKNEQVRASHILVRSTGNDATDLKKANDIYNELMKGANFEEIALQKSDDGSKMQGGDLGWFGRGQMVKPFEDACYNGKVGLIQKPVKTQFGYHIIKVTDRSKQDFVVEKIVNRVQVSASTIDKLFTDAQDFSYIAKEGEFEAEAKMLNYDVIETPPFNEETQALPGIGISRALVKFAFENSVGDVSDVYRVSAGYVVAMISDVIKPGVKKLDDVKMLIKNNVLREKKFEKAITIAKQIRTQIGDNGNPSIAKSVWASARIDSALNFTTVGNIPGIGREFAFSEYTYKSDLNKWSQPVKGSNGVYLLNVRYRTNLDLSLYEFQKEAIKKELIRNKKNQYIQQWIQNLKKEADIVDDRHLFFR